MRNFCNKEYDRYLKLINLIKLIDLVLEFSSSKLFDSSAALTKRFWLQKIAQPHSETFLADQQVFLVERINTIDGINHRWSW